MIATRIVHLEQNLVGIQFKQSMIFLARRLQNQLLEIKIPYFLRDCHHCDEIEIVHLEQNLVGIQFKKV